ncbi:ABC transporter ATP-binding protein [Psychromonas ingrahamii 37]|uniref:ABC transporter ATP-binding protein n=1 Tax=Psychromonas ingrahamii (strain DSM 17664 / CCUG 51855 / 37) TaxID=357804 RepID=A1SY87_PSYIN|nr:putative 2-aminoethylphosphonate ABC transporter ATP-binding protein [Psychromonas ingrahamii]ABM04452.1 ABC transporter ATP-binding protein [Psychromonas ingrahamii 37]
MQTYLNIDNVVKKFGQFTALEKISFSIKEGEFVCFLGPSGCGKTTLLRCIAGLEAVTSGLMVQAGTDITHLPPEKRDFGIVFQSYALFPNLTVQDNIALGLKNQGHSNYDCINLVNKWLAMVGLTDFANQYPNQLSGGQQQRVALARALALSPGLLLLDEPLSALDAKVRTYLREEICRLQKKLGITSVMVTHDQEEALAMADRIVVMNQGVIEQIGSPQEIYEQPATRFVANFVGTMNFISASIINKSFIRIGESLLKIPENTPIKGIKSGLVDLAIRPECLYFCSESENSISVKIQFIEFQGAYYQVECQLWDELSAPSIYVNVPVREARKLNLKSQQTRNLAIDTTQIRTYSPTYKSKPTVVAA